MTDAPWSLLFPPAAGPVLMLAGGALAALTAELAAPASRRGAIVLALTVAAILAAAALLPVGVPSAPGDGPGATRVDGRLALDGLSRLALGVVLAAALASLAISAPALDRGEPAAFAALLLLASAGMGLTAAARTTVMLFLGLELLSLSLYVLVAYHRTDPAAREGALKYLLLGSVASGALLLGVALVYAATGEVSLEALARARPSREAAGALAGGFVLILVGIAFKLALAPLHLWAPDAYGGAGLGVTAFMAVATKAAAFAALLRVALAAPVAAHRPLWALAAASMLVGSLGALRQTDLRRLIAYSGIANAGYLLVALPGFTDAGIEASLFYLVSYALINLGLFLAAAALHGTTPRSAYPLDGFEGAASRLPGAAWSLVLFLLALVGMPLTGGFVGKVLLVAAALREGAGWLALFLVASTAVLAYPYLRLVQRVVRRGAGAAGAAAQPDAAGIAAGRRRLLTAGAAASAAAVVALGVWPEPLLSLARSALALL